MSDLSPAQALQIYAEDMTRRNYASSTIKGYGFYVERFFLFLSSRGITDLASVTLQTILDYHRALDNFISYKRKPLSEHTKESSIRTVRRFFRFLKRKDLILLDPTAGLPPIHAPDRFPRCIMTRSEIERLLSQPNTKTLTGFRDRAIMETLYSTGIRRQELTALTVYDIDFSNGLLRVNQGKGKKDRVVPIGKVAVKYVKEYLENVRPKLANGRAGNALFVNYKGLALRPNALGTLIRSHVRRSGIEKPISCHTFRHTCATEMLKGGSNIRYVQEMLGHAHIVTTQIYTRVVPIDLKKAHRKSHPRERKRNKDVPSFSCGGRPLFRQPNPLHKRR